MRVVHLQLHLTASRMVILRLELILRILDPVHENRNEQPNSHVAIVPLTSITYLEKS